MLSQFLQGVASRCPTARCCAAALLAAALTLPLVAQGESVLTLDRVRALALEQQPQLQAQDAALRAVRNQGVQDAQLPDPRLKLGLQNLPVETLSLNRDPMTQTMVSIEQSIPGGNKRALRASRAEAEAAQITAERRVQLQQIERDAGIAFVALQGAQRERDVARELSRETANQVAALEPALRSGRTTQADWYAARQTVTMSHHREQELEAAVGRARAELSRWIGDAADAAEADRKLMQWPEPPPLAELRARLESHPEHLASGLSVAVADADLALAREAGKPDKSIEIGYGKRARAFDDMVTIQFSMDLPLAKRDRQDRGVAARAAQVERAQAMRDDHLRVLRAELGGVYAEWESVRSRLQLVAGEHLPDAQHRVEAALAAYRSSRGEMSAVLEARRAELEAQLLQVELETQLARLRLQIAYYERLGDTQ